jgi:hypothetical protein
VTGAAKPVLDTVTQTVAPLQGTVQSVTEAVKPLVQTVGKGAPAILGAATQASTPVVGAVTGAVTPVVNAIAPVGNVIAPIAVSIAPAGDVVAADAVLQAATAPVTATSAITRAALGRRAGPAARGASAHTPVHASTHREESQAVALGGGSGNDGGPGLGAVLTDTASLELPALTSTPVAPSASTEIPAMLMPPPDRSTAASAFITPLHFVPSFPNPSLQPVQAVRGDDAAATNAAATKTSRASGGFPGLPELPSLPSVLGATGASAAGSGVEIPAALLAALLLVAPRLGRRLRPTPDLRRPPLYVLAVENPG